MEERALRDLAKRGSLRDFRSEDLAEGMRAGGCERSDAVVTASKMCAGMSIAMGGRATGVDGSRAFNSCSGRAVLLNIPDAGPSWPISRPVPSR